MKILVSAFEPFGGESINPALEAAALLRDADVVKLTLPVRYAEAAKIICAEIDRLEPDAVISVGQAGGRDAVTPERQAVNERSSAAPDSAGRLCQGEKIDPEGEDRLESTFGAEQIACAINASGLPARVSDSAGTYVCNDVMYSVLAKLKHKKVPAGFIHLPFCTGQATRHPGAFTMEISDMARALEIAVATVKQIIAAQQ